MVRAGAGEGVDGLGGVADHAEVVAAAEPEVEQGGLDRADVLVLVDDEVVVLPADLGGDPLVLGEDGGRAEQHVLEVDAVGLALDLLVGGEHGRDRAGVEVVDLAAAGRGDGRVVVGADVADLAPLDLGGQVAQRRLLDPEPVAPGGAGHEGQLGVHEGRQRTAVHLGPEVAGLAQRRGVEGARLHPRGAEGLQPGAHLARGADRERHREDLLGVVDAGGHAVGDAVGQGPGLARAGAGEHPHRAAQRERDLPLLGVEPAQQGLRVTSHAGRRPGRPTSRRGRERG